MEFKLFAGTAHAKITPVTTDVEGVWRLITQKAYELYEQRDKQDG